MLPLVCVDDTHAAVFAFGSRPLGIVAIGAQPTGVIAIGGMACGVVAVGVGAAGGVIAAGGGAAGGVIVFGVGAGYGVTAIVVDGGLELIEWDNWSRIFSSAKVGPPSWTSLAEIGAEAVRVVCDIFIHEDGTISLLSQGTKIVCVIEEEPRAAIERIGDGQRVVARMVKRQFEATGYREVGKEEYVCVDISLPKKGSWWREQRSLLALYLGIESELDKVWVVLKALGLLLLAGALVFFAWNRIYAAVPYSFE